MANGASATVPDKLQPHNIEAEEAVLGSLLIDPDAIIHISTFLKPADFYIERHAWVYEAINDLHERREPADLVTLSDELERRGQLGEIGGAAYLTSLINTTPTSIHAEYYARIVERTAVLRRLIDAAGKIAQLAYQDTEDVGAVVDRAEEIIFGISERRVERDLRPIRQVLDAYYDRVEYLYQHQGEVIGIPTGLADLDKLLGGLQRSDMVVVAGRPGMGKTSVALSIALQAARQRQKRVAMFSLEMSDEQLVQRLVSAETGIDSQRLRLGNIKPDEWPTFYQAIRLLSETSIFIDDTPAITALELRAKARRLHAEHGLDLLIVDYLQLMSGGTTRGENRQQEISFISRSIKGLARELNIPILALSQLSRQVESRADKRPMLSDLRESGCLTGDTLIYQPITGCYVPIRELVGQSGFQVTSLNPYTWKLETQAITHAFCTGVKTVYRLTTQLGRSVRATANHKFLTIRGWKRLDELEEGERIAVPRFLKSQTTQSMTNAELALLGHLIGDGCTLPRHAIQYTTREEDLANSVASLAIEVFGSEVSPRIRKERTWYQVYLSATQHLTHATRNPIAVWLDELGAFGFRSHEKRVPGKVFEQPQTHIATFLRHLWATDGCIHLNPGRHYASVYYASSSEGLARDVQSLLLRLGINARLSQHPQNGKGRDQYHVVVSGKLDLERFIDIIGTLGQHKQQQLKNIEAYLANRRANTNRDIVPHEIWRMYAVPAMQHRGITTRQLHAKLGNAYCGTTLYKQNLSRERAAKLAQVVASDEIGLLAESDVYWDNVASIVSDGEEEVFDLTVPESHNFIANDIIVHNSIEQDADVVLFIYRDDVYNPDTEFPNIAEIIVSKHRSGPTGIFSVYFKKHLAQFVDLEVRVQPLHE